MSQGYHVVEMFECEYKSFCKQHPKIYEIAIRSRPNFARHFPRPVSETHILNAAQTGDLFGMIECDISVPETW